MSLSFHSSNIHLQRNLLSSFRILFDLLDEDPRMLTMQQHAGEWAPVAPAGLV
jgi:hypothetical protein